MVGVALLHLRAYPWRIYGTRVLTDTDVEVPSSPGSGSSVQKGEDGIVVRKVSRESDGGEVRKVGLGGAMKKVFAFKDYWMGLDRGFRCMFRNGKGVEETEEICEVEVVSCEMGRKEVV